MGTLGFKCYCGFKIVKDLKLVEIVTIIVVCSVEDKKPSTISFMKSKLHNCLTTHLNLVVQMYIQTFFYKLETTRNIFEFPLTFPKKNLEMPPKKTMNEQIQYKILLNRIKNKWDFYIYALCDLLEK